MLPNTPISVQEKEQVPDWALTLEFLMAGNAASLPDPLNGTLVQLDECDHYWKDQVKPSSLGGRHPNIPARSEYLPVRGDPIRPLRDSAGANPRVPGAQLRAIKHRVKKPLRVRPIVRMESRRRLISLKNHFNLVKVIIYLILYPLMDATFEDEKFKNVFRSLAARYVLTVGTPGLIKLRGCSSTSRNTTKSNQKQCCSKYVNRVLLRRQ